MMLVNLPVTAWARAILLRMHTTVASISADVDDKVIRSGSFAHLKEQLARTVKFDRLSGQYLNFDKSMGLCTHKKSEAQLRALRIDDRALLIVRNAKSLGALVSSATLPSNFIVKKRVDAAVLTAKRIQRSPI